MEHTGTLVVPPARAPERPPAALDSRQGPDRRLTLHGRSPTCHAERPARPRSVPRGTRALQHAMGVFGRIPTSSAFQQLSGSHGVRAPCFTWNGSDPPEFHVEPHPGAEAPARYPIEFSRAHRPGGPGERNPGPGLGPGHRWVGHHGRVRVVPRGTLDDPCDHLVRLFHVEHDRVGSRWVSGRWRERVKGTRRSVAPPARIGDIVSDGSTWNPGDHACGSVCGFPCRRPHTVCVRYVARRFVSPALPAAVVSEPSRLRMLRTRLDPADRRFLIRGHALPATVPPHERSPRQVRRNVPRGTPCHHPSVCQQHPSPAGMLAAAEHCSGAQEAADRAATPVVDQARIRHAGR